MEGSDISNFKSKINNSTKGYSLIELVVAMGIMAVLGTLGASGLIVARNSAMVNATQEELVTAIRQAQNNSISVKGGKDCPNKTKLWGVTISNDNFFVNYYCSRDGVPGLSEVDANPVDPLDPEAKTGLKIYDEVSIETVGSTDSFVYFSTPFGTGYTYTEADNPGPAGWFISPTNPQQDWVPCNQGGPGLGQCTSGNQLTINISFKGGYNREVIITADGDVYAN